MQTLVTVNSRSGGKLTDLSGCVKAPENAVGVLWCYDLQHAHITANANNRFVLPSPLAPYGGGER